MSKIERKGKKMLKTAKQLAELGGLEGDGSRKHKRKLKKFKKVSKQHDDESIKAYKKLTPQEKANRRIVNISPVEMESNKQKRIKKRLDRRQSGLSQTRDEAAVEFA